MSYVRVSENFLFVHSAIMITISTPITISIWYASFWKSFRKIQFLKNFTNPIWELFFHEPFRQASYSRWSFEDLSFSLDEQFSKRQRQNTSHLVYSEKPLKVLCDRVCHLPLLNTNLIGPQCINAALMETVVSRKVTIRSMFVQSKQKISGP